MTDLFTLQRPRLIDPQVSLRPYQVDAINAIRDEYRRGVKSTLLVLPTGMGKTITFGSAARSAIEKNRRVLILAHRGELIQQAVEKLDLLGVSAEIEMADQYARSRYPNPDCVVATVQTLRGDRLASWPRDYFGLVVTDEAHHATSKTYRDIYAHFSGAHHLGVTATADRMDGVGLGEVYESVAYETTLWDAMTAPEPGPYLCRLTVCQRDISIDLRGLKTPKGDYSDAELETVLQPIIEPIANAVKHEVGDRRTIIFTPGVRSAEGMASALRSIGMRAESVSGVDPGRADKFAGLHSGSVQILCNCMIATEGFDCPAVAAIVLCRPTKSRPLVAQMIGRGTRLYEGKRDCLVIDFDYLTDRHDLVRPADLLGDPDVASCVARSRSPNERLDLVEETKRARVEIARRKAIEIASEERRIAYRSQCTFDPLDYASRFYGSQYRPPRNASARMATDKQQAFLAKIGVPAPQSVTRDYASFLISNHMQRWKNGLCTIKQIKVLVRNGTPIDAAREMTMREASARIDEIFSRRREIG